MLQRQNYNPQNGAQTSELQLKIQNSSKSRRGLQGAFAEAQALFLHPQQKRVAELASVLAAHKMGVVAHFYMDPEVSRGPSSEPGTLRNSPAIISNIQPTCLVISCSPIEACTSVPHLRAAKMWAERLCPSVH